MKKLLLHAVTVAWVTALSTGAPARDIRVVPTASFGLFMEFGDEAGLAGGFALWLGGSLYPTVDPNAAQTTGFASFGVQLRTGLIPLLTGPNEIIPALRAGVVWLGGPDFVEDDRAFSNLVFPRARLYTSFGYRFAFAFGWDNMKRRRKDEQALRLGVGFQAPIISKAAGQFPVPNGLELLYDVNRDRSFDRWGFDLTAGF